MGKLLLDAAWLLTTAVASAISQRCHPRPLPPCWSPHPVTRHQTSPPPSLCHAHSPGAQPASDDCTELGRSTGWTRGFLWRLHPALRETGCKREAAECEQAQKAPISAPPGRHSPPPSHRSSWLQEEDTAVLWKFH